MNLIRRGAPAAILCAGLAVGQELEQHQIYTLRGGDLLDHAGAGVASLGDLDGDGRDEVAVGASRARAGGVGFVEVFDGATGLLIYRIDGPALADSLSDRFGAALSALPDVDGDGVAELAVGAPRDDDGGDDAGSASVYSGADGALLHRYHGLPGERLGTALAAADVDGDGVADLVATAPGTDSVVAFGGDWLASTVAQEPPTANEVVLALSGGDSFGDGMAVLGDLDGDGADEVVVGEPAFDGVAGADSGAWHLFSGATGFLAHTAEGDAAAGGLGQALVGLQSVDGDGYDELVAGAPWRAGVAGQGAGQVRAVAGAWLRSQLQGGAPAGDGTLFSAEGVAAGDGFGRVLCDLGDVDGDGVGDLAVTALRGGALSGGGSVAVLSGVDGSTLLIQGGGAVGDLRGWSLAVGDVDGNGGPDLVLGAPRQSGLGAGAAKVVSGSERSMAADGHFFSIVEGGLIELHLQGPSAVAGEFYFVLGSASGTSPGLPSPVGTLPINFDGYSLYTLTPNPDLSNFWGTLDASGAAGASVFLPPNSAASLLGVQLHYAWFTLDLATPGFPTTAVSNAVPVTFVANSCLAFPGAPDCNGNGIIDACDISDGTSIDCNGNGIPDECELLAGGVDADFDGILDACQTVVYVDQNATGLGNGSSWANAFTELRTALTVAPDYSQIWVAVGTYTPWPDGSNQGASFMLEETVGVYGGFVGGETSLDQRDWENFAPTLSGDVLFDDGDAGGGVLDNAWNVVQASQKITPLTVLDGFRITAGNAVEVAGCDVFAVFFSSCRGGGIYAEGSPTIRNCTIEGNFGGHHGGGAYVLREPRFVNCTFSKNAAIRGAGLYCDVGARPVVQDCRFVQNEAQFGGGMFATGNSTDGPRMIDSVLVGNSAAEAGGAIYLEVAPVVLEGVAVVNNTSLASGGGIYSDFGSAVQIRNSILWNNTGAGGSSGQTEQLQGDGGAPSVAYSIVEGWNGSLGGVGNSGADPLFVDLDGIDNFAGNGDDDLRLATGSPARDAGDTTAVASDSFDLDGDGDTVEPKPFDAAGNPRIVDDPTAPNTGVSGSGGVVDIGPFEG